MKKFSLLLLFAIAFTLFASNLTAQVNEIYVGSGETYQTLYEVFNAMSSGTETGEIVILITSDITETTSSTILGSGTGSFNYESVTIRPEGSNRKISADFAGYILYVYSAQNITIDGRIDGSGSNNQLTFENISGNIISFEYESSNDTIKYCNLYSNFSDTNAGIIKLSGRNGMSNILIDHCSIGSQSSTVANAILSAGNVTQDGYNRDMTVSNCEIFNFWDSDYSSKGINLQVYNESWTISNNSFYQTATRTATTGNAHYGIYITDGDDHVIEGNDIGGSEIACGGSPWTISGDVASTFSAIYLEAGITTPASIQGNTVQNFEHTYNGPAINSLPGIWSGIYLASGNAYIGNITSNTIGSDVGTGSIIVNNTSTAKVASYGIGVNATDSAAIHNNKVGSVTLTSSSTDYGHSFSAIEITGGSRIIVDENLAGSESTTESINATTDITSTANQQFIYGIKSTATGDVVISNNTISNITNNASGLGGIVGIDGTNGIHTIQDNAIHQLYSNSDYTNTYSLKGISLASTSEEQTIEKNLIHNLSNINTSGASEPKSAGIYFSGSTTGQSTIERNTIFDLSFAKAGGHGFGIYLTGTTYLAVINNGIRLGQDFTQDCALAGIYSSGTNIIVGNSVYITGTVPDFVYTTFAYINVNATDKVKNNIFYTKRTGGFDNERHVPVGRVVGFHEIDYNNYYCEGTDSILLYFTSPDQLFTFGHHKFLYDLETWQMLNSDDANSLNTDPLFAGIENTTPDFRITSSSDMIDAGLDTDLYVNDLEGDLRDETPDIGCDEYFSGSIVIEDGFTLKQAFDEINAGNITGDISIVLYESTTETETAVLYESGYNGTSDYSSVVIGSVDPEITVSGDFAGPLVQLNGAQHVTFTNLKFENANTSGYCVEFTNSADNNTIADAILSSPVQSANTGVITFGTSSGTGNSNNSITSCKIQDYNGSAPVMGIVSLGTEGHENTNNSINACEIVNFWSNSASSAAVYLDENNAGWSITDNDIYQENSVTAIAGNDHYGLYLASSDNHTVTGNFIGGSAIEASGSPWTVSGAFPNTFTGIAVDGNSADESTIQGNTIGNFSWSSSPAANVLDVSGIWCGIYYGNGILHIQNNTIGSVNGNSNISVVNDGSYHAVSYGIAGNRPGAGVTISSNTVGSIDVSSSSTDYSHSFTAIHNDSATVVTIDNNLIGSESTAESIHASNACVTADVGQHVAGIVNKANTTNCQISNNIIENLINATVGSWSSQSGSPHGHLVAGIKVQDGSNIIDGNTVQNISTSSEDVRIEPVMGICIESEVPNQEITNNTIVDISNTQTVSGIHMSGIYYDGPSSGTNLIRGNTIYAIESAETGSSSHIKGLTISTDGATDISNNMISLGSSLSSGHLVHGILNWRNGNYYHNSVVVSGSVSGALDSDSYAFKQIHASTSVVAENNVFVNIRTNGGSGVNYAYYLANSENATDMTLDYNCYWVSGTGTMLGYDGNATVSALPIITGKDDNSLNSEVTFSDITMADLHTSVAALNASAKIISGIESDFDGNTRNPLYPDIGADEFTLPVINDPGANFDFGWADVLSPTTAQSYQITALDLTGNLVVTPPANFEVSLKSEADFSSSLTITPVNSNIDTTIYARFAPQEEGFHSGNITNTSSGEEVTVHVQGSARTVPPVIQTQAASDHGIDSVMANALIEHTGGRNPNQRGFICWIYDGTDKVIGDAGVTTIQETGSFTTGTFSLPINTLDANTHYNFRAYAYNGDGDYGGTGYGETMDFWTHADIPEASLASNITGSTVDLSLPADQNPSNTLYAIHETSTNRYVQSDGSMISSAEWQTLADWGTVTVALYNAQNRTGNREYTFEIKARNGENVETEYSAPATFLTLANTPNIMWVGNEARDSVEISVFTYSTDYSNNSTGTLYAIRENTSGLVIGPDNTLGTDTAWHTRDDWYDTYISALDIGSEYSFSSFAKNDDGIKTEPGPAVITYTLAVVPGTPTIESFTTTIANIETNLGANPDHVELAIIATAGANQYVVQTDGTLSANGTLRWQTKADWDAIQLGGLIPNMTYSLSVKARNGNGVETIESEAVDFTTLAAIPEAPEVYGGFTDRLLSYVSISINSTQTEFAVQDSISGLYVQNDGSLGANPVWNTRENWLIQTQYILGLTPSTEYAIRTRARNQDLVETDWGLTTKMSTDAYAPGTPALLTTTSSEVTLLLDTANNPETVTFAIEEQNTGTYIQSDSTLGSEKIWQTYADWGDTILVASLSPDQSVRFRAQARNCAENETGYSGTVDTTTMANVPAAPTVDVVSANRIDVTINANGNPSSVRYAVMETTTNQYIGYNGNASETAIWYNADWSYLSLKYLEQQTEYSFRVKARNSISVETDFGPETSATTPAGAPPKPVLITPVNNDEVPHESITFTWENSEYADSFRIVIAKDIFLIDVLIKESGLTDTTIDLSLYQGSLFYWGVYAINDQGNTRSDVWSFSTAPGPPDVPEPLLPTDGQQGMTLPSHLNWTDVNGATSYHVQVSTSPDFSTTVIDEMTNGDTEWHELTGLNGLTTYYWRVKAHNSYGESDWSEAWLFKTGNFPDAPVLIAPEDNAYDLPTSIKFSWHNVEYANTYTLQIASTIDMNEPFETISGIMDTTFYVDRLSEYQPYFWRVNATGGDGTGAWSEIRYFETGKANFIREKVNGQMITAFPNPAKNYIYFSGIHNHPVRIKVVSLSGKILIDKYIEDNKMDVHNLLPGNYLMHIETSDGNLTGGFVKF